MTWKVRHEGSPSSIDGLELRQVIEGLQDGLWEPTDEVMGPQDTRWTAIESHPQLADVAADVEPPPAPSHPDETHLDMTALIDVTMVLLIFFILLMSVAQLQKALAAGDPSSGGVRKVPEGEARETMIIVTARPGPDGPTIRVGSDAVELKDLRQKLNNDVADTHRTKLLIDATGVPEWVVVAIEDAAAGTGITKRYYKKQGGAAPAPAQ